MNKSVLLLLLLMSASFNGNADKWIYGAAYQFETGDFSQDQDTDIVTVPVYVNYYKERWGFGVEVPFVSVSGSSDIIPSGNGQATGHGKHSSSSSSSESSSYTRSGIGDVSVFISYAFPPETAQELFYEISTSIKLPTANDEDNLGTGETDYSFKLDIAKDMGNWSPSLSLGYQITGESAGEDLNNIYFYSIATGYSLSDESSIALGYEFEQAVSEGFNDASSVRLSFTQVINQYIDLGFGISKGLSDNSPDYGYSLFITGYY